MKLQRCWKMKLNNHDIQNIIILLEQLATLAKYNKDEIEYYKNQFKDELKQRQEEEDRL